MRIHPIFVVMLLAVVLSMVSGGVSIGEPEDPHCVQECHTTPTSTGYIRECKRVCHYEYTPGGGGGGDSSSRSGRGGGDSSTKGGRGKVRRAFGFFSSAGVAIRPEEHRFGQCIMRCQSQFQSPQHCWRQCQSEVASGAGVEVGVEAGGESNDACMLDVQA